MGKETELEEREFIDAFNTGYIISKYSPEIGELLVLAKGDGPKLNGLKAGREQCLAEGFEDRVPDWFKKESQEDPGRQPTPDKDLDIDLEPEL